MGLSACRRRPLTGHHNTQTTANKFNKHVGTRPEREGEMEQQTNGGRALGPPPALQDDAGVRMGTAELPWAPGRFLLQD